jgi:hypothetical protein
MEISIIDICNKHNNILKLSKNVLFIDFSDRITSSRKTGYDANKTEYEMVRFKMKINSCKSMN